MSWTSVVLAAPVPPMMPTVAPAGMWSVMSERAFFSALALYLKLTWSKSIWPSGMVSTGAAAFARSGVSVRTSRMRRALASERDICRKTPENIMTELSTCKT